MDAVQHLQITLARRASARRAYLVPREVFLCPNSSTRQLDPTDLTALLHLTERRHRWISTATSTSTTRPCATGRSRRAQPLRRRQADDRPRARRAGRGLHRGRWPGANPKDTEFFRRGGQELDLRHAKLAASGSTRRAAAGPRTTPAPPHCAQRRCRHAGREVVRPARRARPADHARGEPRDDPRHRLPPARRGPAGLPRRRALLRRLPRQP